MIRTPVLLMMSALLLACASEVRSGQKTDTEDTVTSDSRGAPSDPEPDSTTSPEPEPEPDATPGPQPEPEPEPQPEGLPVLGWYTHDMNAVQVEVIATASDGLNTPRDLAFDPEHSSKAWIVNKGDESVVLVQNMLTAAQFSTKANGFGTEHFLARPAAIAWGAPGTFATIHETDDLTQGPEAQGGTPPDFMGPTLHAAHSILFDAGHASHLDMMHNSPNGMGIAWEEWNTYWVFDGYHSAVSRYAFNQDHGEGGTFHGDGEVRRFGQGQFSRVADIPSHMELDRTTGLLYIADTGNNRIATLDTATGTPGAFIFPNYDGGPQYHMDGAAITTLVDCSQHGMKHPSGLAMYGDYFVVGDNATGTIYAFTLQGVLIDWLDTQISAGGLMGMEFDGVGNLAIVDAVTHEVSMLIPKAPPSR